MDLYDSSFKLQDMLDSDMRTDLDEYMSELPRTPGSPLLSNLSAVMPIGLGDNALDSELSDEDIGWMHSSQIYNVSSDLDSINGLLVNPETALPVASDEIPTVATISMSSGHSGTLNVTLTPSKLGNCSKTSDGQSIQSVQVITTTATLVSDVNHKPSQLNLTVAVPTSEISNPKNNHVHQFLSFHKLSEDNDGSKPKSKQKQNSKVPPHSNIENSYPKPGYSYSCLIAMALKNSKTGSLPVNEIYDFMTENFPYFKTAPNGWKNSVRHNLSLNKCFEKIEKPIGNGAQRKGYLWALNPAKVEKMEEELQKWGSRDPAAIRKSMANPERLELIERGALKNNDTDSNPIEVAPPPPPPPPMVKVEKVYSISEPEVKTSVDSFPAEMACADFSPLDAPVGLDNTLPEFDFQKGLWENLCDDRLHFMNECSMDSSSPKHPGTTSNILDEDSFQISSPKSYVHSSYVYSCTENSLSSESSDSEDSKGDSSDVGMTDKSMVCDA